MKNSLSITTLIILSATLIACGGKDKTATTDVLLDSSSINSKTVPSATSTPNAPNTVSPNTSPTTTTITPVSTSVPANPAGQKTAGINPAHGQPGHRCDISVGAPLNSKPTTSTNVSPVQITPSISQTNPVITPTISTTTTTTTTPTVTAPGMNPAHGQPGHRCDISVGAPLNSKPTTVTPGDSSKKGQ